MSKSLLASDNDPSVNEIEHKHDVMQASDPTDIIGSFFLAPLPRVSDDDDGRDYWIDHGSNL